MTARSLSPREKKKLDVGTISTALSDIEPGLWSGQSHILRSLVRHLTALRNVRGFFPRHFSGRGRVRRIVIACITHDDDDDNTTMYGVVNKLQKRHGRRMTQPRTYIIMFPNNGGIARVYFHGAGGSLYRSGPIEVASEDDEYHDTIALQGVSFEHLQVSSILWSLCAKRKYLKGFRFKSTLSVLRVACRFENDRRFRYTIV